MIGESHDSISPLSPSEILEREPKRGKAVNYDEMKETIWRLMKAVTEYIRMYHDLITRERAKKLGGKLSCR